MNARVIQVQKVGRDYEIVLSNGRTIPLHPEGGAKGMLAALYNKWQGSEDLEREGKNGINLCDTVWNVRDAQLSRRSDSKKSSPSRIDAATIRQRRSRISSRT